MPAIPSASPTARRRGVDRALATFLLLHGAASSGWYWHLVEPLLSAAGHAPVAPDLPADDPNAGLADYVAAAVGALDGHSDDPLVVVAQSMAGFVAPVVAEATSADRIALVASMIPNPGERGHDWWANVGHDGAQRRQRRVARERLGLDVETVPGGHLPALSEPRAIAEALLRAVRPANPLSPIAERNGEP